MVKQKRKYGFLNAMEVVFNGIEAVWLVIMAMAK